MYLAGVIINFFLLALLVTKKNKSEADIILAFWLLFIGLHLSLFYWRSTGKFLQFPYFLGFELPLPFVHGPFLYLYTTSLTNQTKNKLKKLLHFSPFILGYFIFFKFLTSSVAHKIYVYENDGFGYESILVIANILIILHGVTYIVLSLLRLKKHQKNINNNFSNTDKINLGWLLYLIIGICFIWVAVIFGNDPMVFSLVVLFIIFIGYFGIKQTGIFHNNVNTPLLEVDFLEPIATDTIPINEETHKIKYEKSKLTDSQITVIHQNLVKTMNVEKLYKNSELSLSDLAQKLSVHPNTLSQAINTVEQKNFYDYINLQRIEEFKKIVTLPNSQKYTLLSLAMECGFNSKTSFNRNFKKATGHSPSEYLRQVDINLIE